MRAYSSMPTADFVAQLRDIAIKANARTAVIDQLDSLDVTDLEAELEIANEDRDDAVKARDQLGLELFTLIRYLDASSTVLTKATKESIKSALFCLRRHDIYTEEALDELHKGLVK